MYIYRVNWLGRRKSLGSVPKADEFGGQKSIEATPWLKQTLQEAANGANKGHLFATQSIQTPQNTAKTSETKNEGGGEGGTQPTKVTQLVSCKRTRESPSVQGAV